MIVQKLHEIQDVAGFLPREEMESLARRLGTPLYRIQEVASFFPHFKLSPPVPVEVHICRDLACALRGSCAIRKDLAARARRLKPLAAHQEQSSIQDPSPVEVKFVSC